MNDILMYTFNSPIFVYIVMPLFAAFLCMMFNATDRKDNDIPGTPQDKWKKDMYDITNFMLIWIVIMIVIMFHKHYLEQVWGITS